MHYTEALTMFLRDCKMRNLSSYTIRNYERAVTQTFEAIGETDIRQVSQEAIEDAVIVEGLEAGRKESSINATLRGIRVFYGFIETRGIVEKGTASTIKLMRERENVIIAFTGDEVLRLLRTIDRNSFVGMRDYAIILTLLETGIRLRELVGIKIQHIKSDYIRITETKGGKERNVPIQAETKRAIDEWLEYRGHIDSDYVFINSAGGKLTGRAIEHRITKYGEVARIETTRCSPHTFRHTFAKMAVQNGANLFELQAILGHSNLEMVRRYVNLFSPDIIKGHAKFSPVNGLHTSP